MSTDDGGLTKESLAAAIEWLYRPRAPRPPPNNTFDWELARKHGLRFSYDGDTVLMGSSEMKRARELGIVKPIKT